jgi:glycosyltransferase involved in cell wall biosynthesis
MIKKLALFSLVISIIVHAQEDILADIIQRDLLTIVLMVKNEQSGIEATLEPFVKAGLQSFLIFDTGSTDATIAVVEAFFKRNNVQHYSIAEEPFIDFATSRNHALDTAEREFPHATFFLMLDAEWYTHNVQGLIDFCKNECDKESPCYLMRIGNEMIDFHVPRLIRVKSHSRFIGVVHEIIPVSGSVKVPKDVYFELGVSHYGYEKSKKRWERDLLLLLKEHQSRPNDPRTTFYLAQTYECLGDLPNAYHYYTVRASQAGWNEENYETFYRLGTLTERLSATDSQYTWHNAFDYYAAAHNILPHRAEPLVRMAAHYWPDGAGPSNVALCYLFAKRACEMEYPENDMLFIDPGVYAYKRYELLSKAAWHVGDFNNGEVATRHALKAREMPHLFNNLAAYINHRAEIQSAQ